MRCEYISQRAIMGERVWCSRDATHGDRYSRLCVHHVTSIGVQMRSVGLVPAFTRLPAVTK